MRGIQLVPPILMKHLDTLHTQCRHIGHLHEQVWCHKSIFWQNDSVLNLAIFTLLFNKGFVSAQVVYARGNKLTPDLLLKPSDTLHTQCRQIEHLHEEVWWHKNTIWQNGSFLNLAIFNTSLLNKGFVSAQIVHIWGHQLVPELLLKLSDILPT